MHTLSKFMYSEKATTFYEISTLLVSFVVRNKSKVEILQNFVTFSEYRNFTIYSRVRHIFLDFKVSRYIEGYSFLSIRGP